MNTADDLGPIYTQLDKIVGFFANANTRKQRVTPAAAAPPPPASVLPELETLGSLLLTMLLPPRVQTELQTKDLYLEIGTDEELLKLPWELLFNGSNYLSLDNFVGRFVNLSKPRILPPTRPATVYGQELEKLKVLVISVPKPNVKDKAGNDYVELKAAIAETDAIEKALAFIPRVDLTVLRHATWQEVYNAMKSQHPFHIIHFNGHASSNPLDSKTSGIVLFDKMLTTGQLGVLLSNSPAVFCFLNACETTQIPAAKPGDLRYEWKKQHNLFGLASAILDTGAYLLGSTWEIEDNTAAKFAECFYKSFLSGNSLGFATREARRHVQDPADPNNLGWASYTLYGDPRLFVRESVPAGIKNPVAASV